jgi:hypothetical protein
MKMAFNSAKEIFSKMPEVFDRSAAAGLDAVIQFNIEGDEGGFCYFEESTGRTGRADLQNA